MEERRPTLNVFRLTPEQAKDERYLTRAIAWYMSPFEPSETSMWNCPLPTNKRGLLEWEELKKAPAVCNLLIDQGWSLLGLAVLDTEKKNEWGMSLSNHISPQEYDLGDELLHPEKYGNYSYVKKLLESGADPNIRDAFGWMPLHLAVRYERALAMVQLLAGGADPNAFAEVKIDGELVKWTPAHMVAGFNLKNSYEIIPYLIEHGADLSLKDHLGRTPYMLAKELRHRYAENAISESMLSKNKLSDKLNVAVQDVIIFFASRKRRKAGPDRRQNGPRAN